MPKLLDLFCGAGGAAMGYHRAGFEVVGVDIAEQPNFPFVFVQADALTFPLGGFDVIHASPPCQKFTKYHSQSPHAQFHVDLLTPIRERLISSGVTYVIENVEGAPLRDPITICGSAFEELRVKRHRLFESNVAVCGTDCYHNRHPADILIMNRGWKYTSFVPVYGTPGCKAKEMWHDAMGIDWMTYYELTQAIPPAYTEYIGRQLLEGHATYNTAS